MEFNDIDHTGKIYCGKVAHNKIMEAAKSDNSLQFMVVTDGIKFILNEYLEDNQMITFDPYLKKMFIEIEGKVK